MKAFISFSMVDHRQFTIIIGCCNVSVQRRPSKRAEGWENSAFRNKILKAHKMLIGVSDFNLYFRLELLFIVLLKMKY